MAHNNNITVIFEHFDGVFDGLLVPVAGAGHFSVRETGHMTAQTVHGCFMSQAGTGAGLVESGDHGLFGQKVRITAALGNGGHFIGHFKYMEELLAFEIFQRKNVTTCKTAHFISPEKVMIDQISLKLVKVRT
ncbi:hypothetical protein SDC9_176615 [bioreactor metagenome]|uniref:Uncharacterized protein n=1 Tax=bioreactor metagenome TaxID=1076179 RepID=A0A645GYP8_9ZZZZ